MDFNWSLYPEDVISNPTAPYVYFQSLPDEILTKVAKEFNRDLYSFNDSKNNTNSIDSAFSFLKQVIQSERGKEEAFLEYLKDKTKTEFDIKLPSLEEDWSPFVRDMQSILDFGDVGLRDLEQERDRLNKNKENFDEAIKKDSSITYIRGVQDTIGKVSKQLETLLTAFKNDFNRSTIAYKVISVIINRYKDVLLEFDSNKKLVLNQKVLVATLEEISIEILHLYTVHSELFTVEFTDKNGNKQKRQQFNADIMNKLLDQDENIDNNIINMITKIKQFPKFRQGILSSLRLNSNKREHYYDMSSVIRGEELIDDTDAIIQTLWTKLHQYEIPKDAIKIIHKESDFAEIESMTKFVVSGAINAYNTGSQQAKPDNIIGYLAIDPDKMIPSKNKNIQQLIIQIERIQSKIANVAKNVNQTNTLEYYQNQQKVWNELTDDLNRILSKLRDEYQIFSTCFVIEDSTKNYTALYSSTEDSKLATGPHGGSLGPNLTDQLNKIEVLTKTGGITMLDKAWLTAAIINSGPNMIANSQKTSLQDYLSMFAAILLFDSQLNIAEEAMLRATQQMPSTSVHQIHLFSVNNGYYPLSFVLKLTYDSLKQGLGQIESEVRQGVETEIFGYISEPVFGDTPYDSWQATADLAIKNTKIKMRFLVNLVNTISNLLPK